MANKLRASGQIQDENRYISISEAKKQMADMLKEIQLKIEEKSYYDTTIIGNYEDEMRIYLVELDDINDIIQNKINTLGEQRDETDKSNK